MPSRALAPLLAALLLAGALALPAQAAPRIPDTLQAYGYASGHRVFGGGLALEGGAYDWTLVCGGCYVRFAVREGPIHVVDEDGDRLLVPGVYEAGPFTGIFGYKEGEPFRYPFELHGTGDVRVVCIEEPARPPCRW